jgi:hypothetical protein
MAELQTMIKDNLKERQRLLALIAVLSEAILPKAVVKLVKDAAEAFVKRELLVLKGLVGKPPSETGPRPCWAHCPSKPVNQFFKEF